MTDDGTVQNEAGLEIKVRLIVMDFDCSSDAITRILGVPPTETWTIGQPVTQRAKNVHHENGWMIRSPVDPKATSLENSLRELLRLFPDTAAFARLPQGATIQVTCTIYAHKERPYVSLPATLLGTLGQIRANLDVDIYDLTTVNDELLQ
jgi:hypothetical protein